MDPTLYEDTYGYVPDPEVEKEEANFNNYADTVNTALEADPQVSPEQQSEPQPQQEVQQPSQPTAEAPVQQQSPEPTTEEPEEEETDYVEEAVATIAGTPLAIADFGSDLLRLVGLESADDWWDENSPRSKNGFVNGTRNFLKSVLPEAALFIATRGKLKSMGVGSNLGFWKKRLSELALEAGITAGVTSVLEETSTDKNTGNLLENWFGLDIPWAIKDSDDADMVYKKNIANATGFTFLTGGLGLAFAGRNARRIELKDGTKIDMGADAFDDALEGAPDRYKAAQDGEAVQRYAADPEGTKGYDPFVNEPAEPQARAMLGTDADPVNAGIDQATIANNLGTVNGRVRTWLTPGQKARYAAAGSNKERLELLEEIANGWGDAINKVEINEGKLTGKQINQAIDDLADSIIYGNGDLSTAKDILNVYRTSVKTIANNVQTEYLSEEGLNIVAGAINKLTPYLDGSATRNSSMLQASTVGEIEAASIAANRLDDAFDVTRQQELIFEGVELLMNEDNANRYIAGFSLQSLQVSKNIKDPEQLVQALNNLTEEYTTGLTKAQQKAKAAVAEYKRIAKEDPEYLKPFYKLYSHTNGKIDTQLKMQKWAQSKLGVVRKAFYNGDNIPSYIIDGLAAARYNSVLGGLAPVRALAGNSTQLMLKPLTTLAGSAIAGDSKTFNRSLYVYGGVVENFRRGLKQLSNDWRYANANPESAGRKDYLGLAREQRLDEFEILSDMAEKAKADGNPSLSWRLFTAQTMSAWNNNPIVRWGINAMYAIDGFTTSFLASGRARGQAYDELYSLNNGIIDADQFNAMQKSVYDQMFDANGVIKDDAVKLAAGEIALNLDDPLVDTINPLLNKVPIIKSIFMFPRTGINALKMVNTFSPTSALGLAFGKQRKVLKAVTREEKLEALAAHGINDGSDAAFNALRAEYIGRQLAGTTVVMSAALWALDGNLTGNGPKDAGERMRMMKLGWQPLSFKDPFTGQWRSYRGFEPFDTFLGLVGDIVYESRRADSSITEEMFEKLAFSVSANVSNKTFLSGFEPLVAASTGDPSAWNRLLVSIADPIIPGSGARSILNKIITPQLKDVEKDFFNQLAQRNRFLFPGDDVLKDSLDVYTGQPINYTDPMTHAINAILPFFKTNPGMEPWRQWLVSTGWDNLQTIRTNPVTKETLTPSERQWVNDWIGKKLNLDKEIQRLMTRDDGWYAKKIKEYKKARGFQEQSDFPIKQLVTYQELDRIHNEAFKLAWQAYENQNAAAANAAALQGVRNRDLNRGRVKEALGRTEQIEQYIDESKQKGY